MSSSWYEARPDPPEPEAPAAAPEPAPEARAERGWDPEAPSERAWEPRPERGWEPVPEPEPAASPEVAPEPEVEPEPEPEPAAEAPAPDPPPFPDWVRVAYHGPEAVSTRDHAWEPGGEHWLSPVDAEKVLTHPHFTDVTAGAPEAVPAPVPEPGKNDGPHAVFPPDPPAAETAAVEGVQ